MAQKKIEIPYQTLQTFLSVIHGCIGEARIHADKNKIWVRQVDTANVFMVSIEAECKTVGHPFVFGIEVAPLQKITKFAKGCNVTIEVSEKKIGVKYGRFHSKSDLLPETTIRKDPNPPTIKLPVWFETPGKYLHEALQMGGDRCQLTTKNGIVSFCVTGDSFCIKEIIAETKSKMPVKSIFSADYMKSIVNSVKDTSMKINIGIDHPMRACAEKNDCKIEFLLAPRIESD